MPKINPMSLKYMFDEELFFFSNDSIAPSNNNGVIGENLKNISVLTKKILDKSELKLLEKILNALNLSFSDVAINTENKGGFTNFLEENKPEKLILFGISPFEIGFTSLTMGTYEIADHNGIKILNAESFEKYLSAADKKKALWFALQKLFG